MSKDQTLTPLSLLKHLGKFDYDPCGFRGHNTAKKVNLLPTDGLTEKWEGFVWLNPPYSNPSPWLKKMKTHNNGIALVLASTETRWFHNFVLDGASCLNFLKGRPQFLNNKYQPVSLMRGVLLVGYGKEARDRLNNIDLGRYLELTPKQGESLNLEGGK